MSYSHSRRKKAAEKSQMKKLRKELLNKPLNITAVFIALNEEKSIPRLAKSLKYFSNRNVIVDTGSTDKTIEVAKEHGFEVYEMEWPKHFGKARNKAVELAKCNDADWIAMFDADEVLTKGVELKQQLKLLKPQIDLVAIYHKTGVGHRFHRNCIWKPGQAEWKFSVHEHLLSTHNNKSITLDFDVLHPDAIGTEHDKAGLIEMLANDAEEYPDNATRQYYYGRQLYYESRLDCLPFLNHCAKISTWDAEAANALVMMANIYSGKALQMKHDNKTKEAEEYKQKSLDCYRGSVVKYPKLRASYAGIIREETDREEIVRAGLAALSIKESTFFDDSPKFYTDEFESWVKEKIAENAVEQIEINENITVKEDSTIDVH